MIFFFRCIFLLLPGISLLIITCSPPGVKPRLLNIEKVKKVRFIPDGAHTLSESLKNYTEKAAETVKKVSREEIISMFQADKSAARGFVKFTRELKLSKTPAEWEYLFFRFTEGRAFLPFHRGKKTHLKFVQSWVNTALNEPNDEIRKLYSDYYYRVKPVRMIWRRFNLENPRLNPGSSLRLSAFYLKKKTKKNQAENYTILIEKEKIKPDSRKAYLGIVREKVRIANRNFQFEKKLNEAGRYRISVFNKYFYQHFIVMVSEIQALVKNDGELLTAWVQSSNKGLKPPFNVTYNHMDGRQIRTRTDSLGICHLFNDIVTGDSIRPFSLEFEKQGNITTLSGSWGMSRRTSKILDVHLFSGKKFYEADEWLVYRGLVQRRLVNGDLVDAGADSITVNLKDTSGNLFTAKKLGVDKSGFFKDSLKFIGEFPRGKFFLTTPRIKLRGTPGFSGFEGKHGKLDLDYGRVQSPGQVTVPGQKSSQRKIASQKTVSQMPRLEYSFAKSLYSRGDTVQLNIYSEETDGLILLTRESNLLEDARILKVLQGKAGTSFALDTKERNNYRYTLTWFYLGRPYYTMVKVPLGPRYNAPIAALTGKKELKPGETYKGKCKFAGKGSVKFSGRYLVSLVPFDKYQDSRRILDDFIVEKENGPYFSSVIGTTTSGVASNPAVVVENKNSIKPVYVNPRDKNEEIQDPAITGGEQDSSSVSLLVEKMGLEPRKNLHKWESGWKEFENESAIKFKIPLREKGGEWVVNVSGVTSQGRFSTSEIVTAMQDMEVYLNVPRQITAKDQVKIKAVAINNTSRMQEGKYTLNYHGINLTGKSGMPDILRLKPRQHKYLEWNATADEAGSGFAWLALQNGSRIYNDTQAVQIYPNGDVKKEIRSGFIRGEKSGSRNYYKLGMDVAHQKSDNKNMQIETYPGMSDLVHMKLGELSLSRKSNLESIISSLTPAIAFRLSPGRVKESRRHEEPFTAELQSMLAVVAKYGNPDGGFGWTEAAPSNPLITCLAVDFLRLSRELLGSNWQPSYNRYYTNARGYLTTILAKKNTPDDLGILVLNTLSKTTEKNKLFRYLKPFDDLHKQSSYSIALLLEVYHNLELDKMALGALKLIEDRVIEIKSEVSWNGDFKNAWFSQPIEVTGRILEILCLWNPKHRFIEKIIPYLGRKYGDGKWISDKTTAVVLRGLIAWLEVSRQDKHAYTGKIFLNGKKIHQFNSGEMKYHSDFIHHVIPAKIENMNQVILGFEGRGDMIYSGKFNYVIPDSWSKPRGTDIKISKKIRKITYRSGKIKRYAGQNIHVGDELEVEWGITSKGQFNFILIEDTYSSAVSFLPRDSSWYKRHKTKNGIRDINLQVSQNELKGALHQLNPGKYKYYYYLRAENPGRFTFRPAELTLPYNPGVSARSTSMVITLAEKK